MVNKPSSSVGLKPQEGFSTQHHSGCQIHGTSPQHSLYLTGTKVKLWLCSFPLLLLNISNAAISHFWTEGRPGSRVQDPEQRLEQWVTPQSCLLLRAQAAQSWSITASATALAWHFYKYQWREMDTSPMLMMNCFLAASHILYFATFSFKYSVQLNTSVRERRWTSDLSKQYFLVGTQINASEDLWNLPQPLLYYYAEMKLWDTHKQYWVRIGLSVPQKELQKDFLLQQTKWLKLAIKL